MSNGKKFTECDKLIENTIIVNAIKELDMLKTMAYQTNKIKSKGMKVYFEFPEPTENDYQIKKEVKDILINSLQEQSRKVTDLKTGTV